MTVTSKPTQTGSERETLYANLMANYHPPLTLRTSHKNQLKVAWSARQGYDGSKLECSFCNKVKAFAEITVHHKDGNEEHNDPDNVAPGCWDCHMKEGWIVRRRKKAEASERERERGLIPTTPKFEMEKMEGKASSSETARAEKMRPRWDDWIAGRVTRPSMLDHQCQLWNNAMLNIREWCDLESITERAPAACQLGSSKTYWKYGKEDIQAGKFERDVWEGKIMVRYNLDFAGMVAANLKNHLKNLNDSEPKAQPEERVT